MRRLLLFGLLLLCAASPAVAQYGTGNDGAITVSGTVNINGAVIAAGRTYADGIAYRVTAPAAGATSVVAANTVNGLVAGDEVLLINLQGAPGDSLVVGKYEFLIVQSVSGTTVNFTTSIVSNYQGNSAANQRVVIQRVPNYSSVTLSGSGRITTLTFDQLVAGPSGAAGYHTGVTAFRVSGTLTLGSGTRVDADYAGYIGGAATGVNDSSLGQQGAGAAGLGSRISTCAPDGQGGGGGYYGDCGCCTCAGGGGGGYGSAGTNGNGGTRPPACAGVGGVVAGDSQLQTLLFGGGGGGGGSATNTFCGQFSGGAGGAGGGIVFIAAFNISSSGIIAARGVAGQVHPNAPYGSGGGGGAGGSILILYANGAVGTTSVSGGDGALGGGCETGICGGDGGPGSAGRIVTSQNYETPTPTSTSAPTLTVTPTVTVTPNVTVTPLPTQPACPQGAGTPCGPICLQPG